MSPAGLLERPTAPDPGPGFPDLFDALPSVELPCRLAEEDLWFSEAPADLERAKGLCGACPIRRACLAGALERREYCGVWGGEIFDRGAVIARKRPRGRPSKADLARDAELAAARAASGVA
ncbi:WhiB family transcriptional regulator [Actinomycetospora sp. CA-053990]|uniref:WhiB family transcriptional regulator n=1 Tax=Actinomycetospora sp. CA-053990 TaxID=3239891 RepID=UPI003D8CFF08